jgi:hypothetical protein
MDKVTTLDRARVLPFAATNGYIDLDSLIGRKAGCFNPKSESYVADGGKMDHVVEQVVETKEETVELTLAELAQVGGGVGAVAELG